MNIDSYKSLDSKYWDIEYTYQESMNKEIDSFVIDQILSKFHPEVYSHLDDIENMISNWEPARCKYMYRTYCCSRKLNDYVWYKNKFRKALERKMGL